METVIIDTSFTSEFGSAKFMQFKPKNGQEGNYKEENYKKLTIPTPMQICEEKTTETEYAASGVTRMWNEFKDRTTLHGLKHASGYGRFRIRGCIWLIAVLCMTGCLIYTVSDLYVQYYKYKTNTNLNAELLDKLPFPAVTVCNLSPLNSSLLYSNGILKEYFISTSILGQHDLSIPKVNNTVLNTSNVLNKNGSASWSAYIFRSFGSTLKYCQFEGKDICLANILPRKTSFGMCFTFNPWNGTGSNQPLTTRRTGSKNALIMYLHVGQKMYTHGGNIAAGFKVVVHSPKDEPDLESDGFLISPGFSTFSALRMTKKIYLPEPFLAFGDKHCIDTEADSFVNPLKYHLYYSYNACVRECKEGYTLKKCGCRDYTDIGKAARICSFREIKECVQKYSDIFEGDEELKNSCHCYMPCESTSYQVQTSFAFFPSDVNSKILERIGFRDLRKDYLEVRIFYDSLTLLKIKQLPEYTIDTITGTLGGQMGLFLGASLLTISEFLEFCLLLLFQVMKMLFERKPKHKNDNTECGCTKCESCLPVTSVTKC